MRKVITSNMNVGEDLPDWKPTTTTTTTTTPAPTTSSPYVPTVDPEDETPWFKNTLKLTGSFTLAGLCGSGIIYL
jgi:hypothetical protein